MPGLVPGIHVLTAQRRGKTWMAGTSPAMTKKWIVGSFASNKKAPANAGAIRWPITKTISAS
jgi:hypothetical protein